MSIPVGERRIVSVLVADVAASTAIGERLGRERSKFLFDEVVRLMREEVERFGGTVAQLTGDGCWRSSGRPWRTKTTPSAPSAQGSRSVNPSPAKATRSAQRTGSSCKRASPSTLVPSWSRPWDEPPERLYNAFGATVNVATRLQSHGDLVVGPETARQLGDRFELSLSGSSS